MTMMSAITQEPRLLDTLMPMHFRMDPGGTLRHAAPTLVKVVGGGSLDGRHVADFFDLRRSTQMSLGDVLVNLSFGIAILDAVSRYHLAGSDFAPTDLTLEMLYLVEANMAAMNESRDLNRRLQTARIEAEAQAQTDTLTGLKNRRALDTVLSRLAARSTPFSLVHLDLDYFKAVNDNHGHAAGDRVLVDVARILLEETREEDAVARIGGDEFVLVFPGLTDRTRLGAILKRTIRRLEEPIFHGGTACRISSSAGVVQTSQYDVIDIDRMHRDADRALYASKEAGRARFTFHDPGSMGGPDAKQAAAPAPPRSTPPVGPDVRKTDFDPAAPQEPGGVADAPVRDLDREAAPPAVDMQDDDPATGEVELF